MSKLKFALFRTLTEGLCTIANVSFTDYHFYYDDISGNRKSVTQKDSSDSGSIEIPGKGSQWDLEENNLIIQRTCTIHNPAALFDISDGIANSDSELGVALIVLSRESSQRAVYSYSGTIVNQKASCVLELNAELPRQTYRRSVELKTVLYLKKKSSSPDYSFFANIEGMVFGVLSDSQLYLEEQSPEFPTRVIRLGYKEPLWKVEIDYVDPRIDTFADTVRVIINESYPGFNELWGVNADERKKNALKIEIYSSAIVAVIERIRKNEEFWNDTVNANLDRIQDGSISDYLCYLFNEIVYDYNLDTGELSLAIRRRLGERE